jgi:hypothetical protein
MTHLIVLLFVLVSAILSPITGQQFSLRNQGSESQVVSPQANNFIAVTVAVPRLNVYAAPTPNAIVIAALSQGDCLVAKTLANGWYQLVLKDGSEGWASAEFLTPSGACPTVAASTPIQSKGIVQADVLNVRSGPGTTFNVVNQLTVNDCVDVVTAQGGWVQIAKAPNVTGWCSQQFITLTESCPANQASNPIPVAAPVAETIMAAPQMPSYINQPYAANALTTQDAYIFECFGSGANELRFAKTDTPVQVLGTGAFSPPFAELGSGPFLKVRLWDGQFAWIPAASVNVDIASQPPVSAQCEAYDRINWSIITPPTPTPYPAWVSNPAPSQPSGCCKICRKGKACGDSCIAASKTCHKGSGCACNG